MKKFYAILCIAIASLTQLQAQAPQGFNYQATVRNSSGDLIVNTNVNFKFNVMQGSQTSLPVFTEIHYVPTDDLGQVNLVIGQGTATTGAFSELDWSLGSYYLGIELDTGSGYVAMGTTQLLSVPYALYAENSGNSTPTTPNLEAVLAENNSAGQQQIKDLLEPTEAQDAVTMIFLMEKISELQDQINTLQAATGSGTVNDQDGNSYTYLTYGAQKWTVENAEMVTYRDGTPIPEVTDNDEWANLTTGAWAYYDNDPTKPRLYNWYAVMGIHDTDPNTPDKAFAPEGWHVPSDMEWTTLEDHLIANGYNYDQSTTENKLAKSIASTTGWNSSTLEGAIGNDQSLNNSSGFNAFPEGYRGQVTLSEELYFDGEGGNAIFWSSTEASSSAWFRGLNPSQSDLFRTIMPKFFGVSVRFVRDSGGGGNGGGGNSQIIPSNLVVNVTIQGQDDQNPNGDGSGQFSATATAINAVKYGFKVGSNGTETQNTTGVFSYTLTEAGTNQFPLYVYAYSSTDDRISNINNLTVYVEGNGGSGNNDVLVWSDEFDGTGPINSSKWTTETGGGGWGNQEVQIYTSSTDNVVRENGILKIKAIKESNGTYSSARIITQDKFEFKYGRVEIRAKLPSAQGTWPALSMLGANYPDVGWPQCGEIDIMEQFQDKNKVKSTLHWKLADGNRGEYGQETVNTSSTDWHIYTIDWTPTSITTYLDGNQFFTMNISGVEPYYPFNEDFFFIFNVAMGGTLGGDIDPNFTEDTMEVDYIRVYQ